MGDPAPKVPRVWSATAKASVFAAVFFVSMLVSPMIQGPADRLHSWWWRDYGEWPLGGLKGAGLTHLAIHRIVDLIGHGLMTFLPATLMSVFLGTLVLAPLGFLARAVARARVRAGNRDPLEGTRRWVTAHPGWVRALTTILPAVCSGSLVASLAANWAAGEASIFNDLSLFGSFGIAAVGFAVALTAASRVGLEAILAPTLAHGEPQTPVVAKEEITFNAVAVTRETRGAVGAMMALNLATIAMVVADERAFRDPRVLAALAAYAAASLGGAALFRHASRIAVGLDGVHVAGTSRSRFFPYNDLDAARVSAGDLELVRGERVVLRLQLHGSDASKRDAVLARVREAIDRVKEGKRAAMAQVVSISTPEQLARAAGGGADYRAAALTREQLWALVEGPEIASATRKAAAVALAKTGDDAERSRLRVAAEQSAAPEVRVALAKLADGVALEDDGLDALAPLAKRSA